jgi:hypothetical protein
VGWKKKEEGTARGDGCSFLQRPRGIDRNRCGRARGFIHSAAYLCIGSAWAPGSPWKKTRWRSEWLTVLTISKGARW